MTLQEPALSPEPTQANHVTRRARGRHLLVVCAGLVAAASLAALVKGQVDRLREAAARTDSV
jgi:hypothetical protein